MTSIDRTLEFKEFIQSRAKLYPPRKPRVKVEDLWTKQAEQVATNLRSLATFLSSIRRAYLDLSSSSSSSASRSVKVDPSKGLGAWEGVRWLSDRERDEVDFGVKIALGRSVDRVRQLEAVEKVRVENNRKNKPKSFLFLPPPPARDDITSNHRSSITLYLNTLLSTVSQIQIKQQEMRVNRQLEKRTMQGGLRGGGIGMQLAGKEMAEKSLENGKGKGRAEGIGEVPAMYRPLPSKRPKSSDDEVPVEATAEQIQQFEAESTLALQSTLSDLSSLRQAETSLLEISSLQSQLAIHLSQQTELSDKLWEESTVVTGLVKGGNVELKRARERNKEGRTWLLVFLIGASLSLVFLDHYS